MKFSIFIYLLGNHGKQITLYLLLTPVVKMTPYYVFPAENTDFRIRADTNIFTVEAKQIHVAFKNNIFVTMECCI
jgi:hypothetical protein